VILVGTNLTGTEVKTTNHPEVVAGVLVVLIKISLITIETTTINLGGVVEVTANTIQKDLIGKIEMTHLREVGVVEEATMLLTKVTTLILTLLRTFLPGVGAVEEALMLLTIMATLIPNHLRTHLPEGEVVDVVEEAPVFPTTIALLTRNLLRLKFPCLLQVVSKKMVK
jgi:hypothetical protein